MKKKTFPEPPKLNLAEQKILDQCLALPNRAYLLLHGSIMIDSFAVGPMPNGDERSLVAYGWINQHEDRSYVMPILLVDCKSRIYHCNGICEVAALVQVIRKDHYRWLYEEFQQKWKEVMQESNGYMHYYDNWEGLEV